MPPRAAARTAAGRGGSRRRLGRCPAGRSGRGGRGSAPDGERGAGGRPVGAAGAHRVPAGRPGAGHAAGQCARVPRHPALPPPPQQGHQLVRAVTGHLGPLRGPFGDALEGGH